MFASAYQESGHYRRIAPIATSSGSGWSGAHAERYEAPAFCAETPYYYKTNTLVFTLRGTVFQEYLQSGARRKEHNSAGEMAVFPAGFAHRGSAERDLRFVKVHFAQTLLERVASELQRATTELVPVIALRDESLRNLGQVVESELLQGCPGGALFGDSIVAAMCARLLGLCGTQRPGAATASGRLSAWQLRRVRDYVEGNLSRSISLARLAEEVSLSPYHFLRKFKCSTGETPYDYVMRARLDAARRWLLSSDRRISDIAAECGYAHSNHFSAAFRRATGMTPSRYRRCTDR